MTAQSCNSEDLDTFGDIFRKLEGRICFDLELFLCAVLFRIVEDIGWICILQPMRCLCSSVGLVQGVGVGMLRGNA